MYMYGCELWNLNNKIELLELRDEKIKRRIWKLPARSHNIIIHNLSYNSDVRLDIRTFKFVYNALNHSNLLHTKLNCMRSTFSENY